MRLHGLVIVALVAVAWAEAIAPAGGLVAPALSPTAFAASTMDAAATSASGAAAGFPVVAACCDVKHPLSVTGEAEESVENSITKVVVSVRISDSIPIDTTPAIEIATPTSTTVAASTAAASATATGAAAAAASATTTASSRLPVLPTAKQLQALSRSVMADATKRLSNVLALIRATSAERLQTQQVFLQTTSVWVPKLSQSVNNGFTASATVSFRIASAAMGSLLVDLLAVGATNIDSVTHVPTEEALEVGRRNAIRTATRRALARGQIAASVLALAPQLAIRNVQVTTSNSVLSPRPVPQPVMFMAMRAETAGGSTSSSTDAAGETEVTAFVALELELQAYSALNQIAPTDVS